LGFSKEVLTTHIDIEGVSRAAIGTSVETTQLRLAACRFFDHHNCLHRESAVHLVLPSTNLPKSCSLRKGQINFFSGGHHFLDAFLFLEAIHRPENLTQQHSKA
jgi:hypothetical protein